MAKDRIGSATGNPAAGPEVTSGFAGERWVRMPPATMEAARRAHPLLRGCLATGVGFFPRAAGHRRRRPRSIDECVILYCVRGAGWCQVQGGVEAVRMGDLVFLPAGLPHAYGSSQAHPWTLHWVHATGDALEAWREALGGRTGRLVVNVGEDLQLVALFNEILQALQRGFAFPQLLLASSALTHLLAAAVGIVRQGRHETADGLRKVARCIEHMSEHLATSLRIGTLASLAGVSPSHLTALFQELTGAPPRDYLHLLRMHQACRWLVGTELPVKEIAVRLGYRDQFHFSRTFKAWSGIPPSRYRESAVAGPAGEPAFDPRLDSAPAQKRIG